MMKFPWKKIIKMDTYFSVMNMLVIEHKDTVFSHEIGKSFLTTADKTFISLIYGAEINELTSEKIKYKDFKNIIIQKYLEMEKIPLKNC